jgi:predicted nucleotide-binding protein (sugar kinase/HSP70/actin superfamily)
VKVTFPHMGNQYIATKVLLEELGVELVVPPECNKYALETGTKYSPESICLPLKMNIGNFIESIGQGADTIILTGSCGPCRFGYYSILQKEILKDMGYNIDVILLDPPQGDYKAFAQRVCKMSNTKNPYSIIKALVKGIRILYLVDALDDAARYKRPRQKKAGEVDRFYDQFHKEIRNVHGFMEVSNLIKETRKKIAEIEEEPERQILKIGITGEIYTIIEPYVNLFIEKKLGNMGVEVHKSLKISHWLVEHLFLSPLKLTAEKHIWKAAKPYITTMIGGHARETIGYSVLFAESGFDGLIQIYPFTCMPEIVAQSIMPAVEEKYQIPSLCFIVDEMTGEAGFITRLEAFVDLLTRRKEQKQIEKLLSGC